MSNPKLSIAVSGLNNIDSPGPGVPVIRALRESVDLNNIKIIGLAYENLEPGIFMPGIADKTYKLPYPSDGIEAAINRLKYIHAQENIDILIPNFDAELYAFIKTQKQLNELGIKTILPTLEQFEERQKNNLPSFGQKYNVKVPKSIAITDLATFIEQEADFSYPVMVKGRYYDAYIAYNRLQVENYFGKLSAKWGFPIIIQQFVSGTEVNVIALGDGKGNTMAAVPMKKQYITDKGKAWGGITLASTDLIELTQQIIEKTKWRGPLELELIRTEKDELYLIEINPRIPAWVYLAVSAGQNIPEIMVKLATNQKVEPITDYQTGKMFVRYSYDLITDINQFQEFVINGELNLQKK